MLLSSSALFIALRSLELCEVKDHLIHLWVPRTWQKAFTESLLNKWSEWTESNTYTCPTATIQLSSLLSTFLQVGLLHSLESCSYWYFFTANFPDFGKFFNFPIFGKDIPRKSSPCFLSLIFFFFFEMVFCYSLGWPQTQVPPAEELGQVPRGQLKFLDFKEP
jgi:hypothetical protein